jgi:diguanylate cyclase (GGDEF)-like protein
MPSSPRWGTMKPDIRATVRLERRRFRRTTQEAGQLTAEASSSRLGADRQSEIARRQFWPPPLGAVALTAAMVVGAGGLYLFVLRSLTGTLDPGFVPWWSLVVIFFAAELYGLGAEGRLEHAALSPHDALIVLGFFLVSPSELLVAQLGGAVLALVLVRRTRVGAIVYRLAALALGTSLAVATFRAIADLTGVSGRGSWAAAVLGAAVASEIAALTAIAARRFSGRRSTAPSLARVTGLALAGSVASASIALAAVTLVESGEFAAVLLFVPFASYAILLRAYASERRRLEHLRSLYDSMRIVGRGSGLDGGIAELLAATRQLLDADVARIVLLAKSSSGSSLQARLDQDGATRLAPARLSPLEEAAVTAAIKSTAGILLTRDRAPQPMHGLLAEWRLSNAMITALRRDDEVLGVLVAGDRADGDPFMTEDLSLFETFAAHAGVLLENDRLEESLSELEELKEQLRHQAYHDALTGLPNRRLFGEHVARALADHSPSRVAVLFLDLDDFKTINDSLGHFAGDTLLQAVAGRVRASVRPHDVPARLGGDEFAVLTENAHPEEAERVAERLVEALEQPFSVDGREISVHTSVGIAHGGTGASTADDLLRNADVAMYDAKQGGKRRYAIYAPEMHAQVRRRQELATALERAVDRGEIDVHFQPIVDLGSRRLVALEALARWDRREHGFLLPGSFIPLADEMGIMVEIGSAVLRESCRQVKMWHAAFPGHGELRINVNLAPSELHNHRLAHAIAAILEEVDLPPDRLVLEITESGVMRNPQQALSTMRALRELGISLALDDFGTGHSSLAHLREFPLDTLKIAQPFVAGLPTGHVDRVFIDAIVRLASSLGLAVVAEGIETAAQANAVAELGCGFGQGFHFGSPLSQLGVAGYLGAVTLPEKPDVLERVA